MNSKIIPRRPLIVAAPVDSARKIFPTASERQPIEINPQAPFTRRELAVLSAVAIGSFFSPRPAQSATATDAPTTASSSAAAAGPPTSINQAVKEKDVKTFVSQGRQPPFRVDLPPGWVVAYDRTSKQTEGSVFLAGNFKTSTTASVSIVKDLGDFPLKTMANGTATPQSVADALTKEVVTAGSTLGFRLVSYDRTEKNGRFFYSYEYEVDICRGEIIEGSKGTISCLGPQLQALPVVKKKVRGNASTDGKSVAILSTAGPPEAAKNEELNLIFDSFVVGT